MRNNMKLNNLFRFVMIGFLGVCGFFLTSCSDDDEAQKWVDLRYSAQDEYTLVAINPEPVVIQVKSTDPWKVYNLHDGWCTIDPATGDDVEKIYDVTVQYADNNQLDDRVDSLIIQSDYWIGKWVKIIQKGTAYLNLENHEGIMIDKVAGAQGSFLVKSNQDWTAKVTEGESWLTLDAGATGKLDGEVKFSAQENKGAKRYATITVYDRHGVERTSVQITQDGVQLDPETLLIKTNYQAQEYLLHVVANTEWTVVKDDEDAEWYSFETSELNGTSDLKIILQENKSSAVRKATFTIESKAVPGIESVKSTIVLKQSNNAVPEIHQLDAGELARWSVNGTAPVVVNGDDASFVASGGNSRILRDKFGPGLYEFKINSWVPESAHSVIFVCYANNEIRFHMHGNGTTDMSTSPWLDIPNRKFDATKSHILGLDIVVDEETNKLDITYLLNGEKLYVLNDYVDSIETATIYMGANGTGTVVYDYWSYTAPINWGE